MIIIMIFFESKKYLINIFLNEVYIMVDMMGIAIGIYNTINYEEASQ